MGHNPFWALVAWVVEDNSVERRNQEAGENGR